LIDFNSQITFPYNYLAIARRTFEENAMNHLVIEILNHRSSQRQMTWFRKIESDGFEKKWLDSYLPADEKTDKIISRLNQ